MQRDGDKERKELKAEFKAELDTDGRREDLRMERLIKYLLFKSANQGEKRTNQPALQRSDAPLGTESNGQPTLFP